MAMQMKCMLDFVVLAEVTTVTNGVTDAQLKWRNLSLTAHTVKLLIIVMSGDVITGNHDNKQIFVRKKLLKKYLLNLRIINNCLVRHLTQCLQLVKSTRNSRERVPFSWCFKIITWFYELSCDSIFAWCFVFLRYLYSM